MSDSATQTQMEHAPGNFCWIELATTDGPGAKKFYSELFDWEAQDIPIGPDMVYTMLKLNGKDVGALYQKGEQMKQVPTHWASYVSVTSADEIAAKTKALGGTVVQDPMDVMDVGRMAVVADPTGAHFLSLATKDAQGRWCERRNWIALLERTVDQRYRKSKGLLHQTFRLGFEDR